MSIKDLYNRLSTLEDNLNNRLTAFEDMGASISTTISEVLERSRAQQEAQLQINESIMEKMEKVERNQQRSGGAVGED